MCAAKIPPKSVTKLPNLVILAPNYFNGVCLTFLSTMKENLRVSLLSLPPNKMNGLNYMMP